MKTQTVKTRTADRVTAQLWVDYVQLTGAETDTEVQATYGDQLYPFLWINREHIQLGW